MVEKWITLKDAEELWAKPCCDCCGRSNRNIVRQNTWDGKLMCEECWNEMIENIKKHQREEGDLK